MGYHDVRAHVRRLELISESELFKIIDIYGLSCPSCSSGDLKSKVDKQNQQVHVVCSECSEKWIGRRELAEETGPRLAEVLNLTKNKGCWEPRWDMLEVRSDSTFRLLRKDNLKLKKNRKTIRTRNYVIPKCPKCGSPMRLVKPRRGNKWKAFWGCTKYRTTGCTGAEDDTGLTPI
jgi:ssDNA-binding Zn-finger/Zn-ribbon topoisomerase 1